MGNERLLTDDEVLKICIKAVKEGKHRPPEICKYQDTKTLKEVRKAVVKCVLWAPDRHEILKWVDEALKQGKMPE